MAGPGSWAFQSTRGPEGPRDATPHVPAGPASGFNPRAAPRDRATRWHPASAARPAVVSIHARPRGTARRPSAAYPDASGVVSIHARPRGTAASQPSRQERRHVDADLKGRFRLPVPSPLYCWLQLEVFHRSAGFVLTTTAVTEVVVG
jgi:hypothetical protein